MRFARIFSLLIGGMIAQWLWSNLFSIQGVFPHVLFVLTVAVASESGPIPGQSIGFIWGLFLDCLSVRLFGSNALAFTSAAYLIGRMRRQMDVSEPPSQAAFVAILTPAYLLFLAAIGFLFEREVSSAGWKTAVLVPFYNGLLAPFAFSLVRRVLKTT